MQEGVTGEPTIPYKIDLFVNRFKYFIRYIIAITVS